MNNYRTNICCLDMDRQSIDYFKSLGMNVFEGSMGSVFTMDWSDQRYTKHVLRDWRFPLNLHEYHVFVHDMGGENERRYVYEDHDPKVIVDPTDCCLECSSPVTRYDIRAFGAHEFREEIDQLGNYPHISIVFMSPDSEVSYRTTQLGYNISHNKGPYSIYDAWKLVKHKNRIGNRVSLCDNRLSKTLFEGRLDKIRYHNSFYPSYYFDGDQKVCDERFVPLLKNELDEFVAYVYFHAEKVVDFVFPQIDDKAALLRSLFENALFPSFSEFFPDIEAKQWIHSDVYLLPEQMVIHKTIKSKEEAFKKEVAELEEKSRQIDVRLGFLKDLLTSSGSELVKAVKKYLEWLGFVDVVDKDETLNSEEIREEDLCFKFNDELVLVEVKGIYGTSTDSECSQVDKIVNRKMRQEGSTKVHGVYIVNNERNTDPLKRTVPPFNKNQISDAENQFRTMVYTTQLYSLYFDIEHGFVSKEYARKSLMKEGLADFHQERVSIGVPYHYYKDGEVICLELKGTKLKVGDKLYYCDSLQRLVELEILEIQQDKKTILEASEGKTSFNVGVKVLKNREIYA